MAGSTSASSTWSEMEGFSLGRPSLVCRWRLAGGRLPMENRHLRALSQRVVNGSSVSPQLVAWAKQHIEWTLADGAAREPDGVLMIVVDEAGNAAMAVGPYEPLPRATALALAQRALRSRSEARETGVAPETLWSFEGDRLVWCRRREDHASGTASLVADLARTLGMPVEIDEELAARVRSRESVPREAFLASDEHGVVLATNAHGPRSERFAAGYRRLLDRTRER